MGSRQQGPINNETKEYCIFCHFGIRSIQQYYCVVYDYVEKAGLSKGNQNPKRKLGVTMHFSEIIELKFGKKLPYILCSLMLF